VAKSLEAVADAHTSVGPPILSPRQFSKPEVATYIAEARFSNDCSNGREAVGLVSEFAAFDVILMDIQMPEMDGFQATAAIREMEKNGTRRTPIVAMTAHAMKGDRERCLQAGMDGYVSKPVQSKVLYETIETIIAARSPLSTSSPPGADKAHRARGKLDELLDHN
jgi:CheY-like chemotaxis protein